MFCRNCGNQIENGEKICNKCGYEPNLNLIHKKVDKQCKYCMRDITEEDYNKYGGYCKNCYQDANSYKNNNIRQYKFMVIIKLALYILAVVVVIMTFNGADTISRAGFGMRDIKSVSGKSIDEVYYQYYGTFLYGLETIIRAIGITSGVVIAYVGKKINVYEGVK